MPAWATSDAAVITEPVVTEVSPASLYGGRNQELVIRGSSLADYRSIQLGERSPIRVKGIALDPESDIASLTAELPADLPPGTYPIRLLGERPERLDTGFELEVLAPVRTEVGSVAPTAIPRHRVTPVTIVVRGSHLDAVENVLVHDDVKCTSGECELRRVGPEELRVTLHPSYRLYTALYPFALELVDGRQLPLPPLELVPPAAPWSWGSWLAFGILILVVGLVSGIPGDTAALEANHEAADLVFVIRWLSRPLITALLLVAAITVVWAAFAGGFSEVSFGFLGVAVLVALNVGTPYGFAWLVGTFHDQLDRRILLALVATPVALGSLVLPFVVTRFLRPQLALPLEGVIFGAVALAGMLGLALADRRLEAARRTGPSDEELDVRIRDLLREHGRISANQELRELPRDRATAALESHYVRNRDRQGLVFDRSTATLGFRREREVALANAAFAQASAANPGRIRAVEEIFRSQLWPALDVTVEPHPRAAVENTALEVLAATFHGVESVVPTPFPLLVLTADGTGSDLTSGGLREVLNRLGAENRFAVLVTLGTGEEVARRLGLRRRGPLADNVVVLDREAILAILTAKEDLGSAFVRICQEQVSFSVFRPYTAEGPAKPDMFFGRGSEVQTLVDALDSGSAAVLGARRIGKTSTVRAVQELLREQGKRIYYLDCYHVDTYDVFFSEIATRWGKDGKIRRGRRLAQPTDFARLVVELGKRHPDQRLVFLFDEIDRLIAYDDGEGRREVLFRLMRSLSQEGHCHFLFSGERTILDQLDNPRSCFFNFVTPVYLELVDRKTTELMVVEPTELLKVQLEEQREILDLVWSWTSGHPNLVQYLFSRIFDELNRRQRRQIDLAMVGAEVDRVTYRDRYIETFWSQATAEERALSIVLADRGSASQADLFAALRDGGFRLPIDQLERGLRYLRLSQLIEAEGDGFRVRPTRFASLVQHFSVSQWLEDLKLRGAGALPGAASR